MTYKHKIFSNRLRCLRSLAACALAAISLSFSPALAAKAGTLVLTVGKADVLDIDGEISDIMVANPSLVDVTAIQKNRLYLVGKTIGDTNIIALDATGNVVKTLDIHVRIDERALQNTLKDLFPDEKIQARTVNNQIVLTGKVSSPARANRIRDLAARFLTGDSGSEGLSVVNMMDVAGEQQVMLRVRIVEASRNVLKELGVETSLNDISSPDYRDGSTALLFQGASQSGLTVDPMGVGTILRDSGWGGIGPMQFVINALEREGVVNTLAEPNLTAISGESAGFLAGGEFPVPVGRDREGNIIIEFHPFGVSLNFKPVVLSSGRMSLQLETEVSSLSQENGLTQNAVDIPGFNVRRASTTVELASGGSLMIAGLLQSDFVKGLNQLPGIGDVPILGELLKSRSFQRDESELVIMVTAYLVEPFADETQADGKDAGAPLSASVTLPEPFARNIRRTYGGNASGLFRETSGYGYLLR